jgi:hypothetical protein
VLRDPDSLPGRLVRAVAVAVGVLVPRPDAVTIFFTGSLSESVQKRITDLGGTANYSLLRGSNLVVAKTMKMDSDQIHVIVNADFILGPDEETPEEAGSREHWLLHLATHEAIHALHHQRGESAEEIFKHLRIHGASEAYFAHEAGTILEEYRAQTTAQQMYPLEQSFLESFESDLHSFAEATATARGLSNSDTPAAAKIQLTAVANIWKAIALIAAEARVAGGEFSLSPDLVESEDWGRFVGPAWAPIDAVLKTLPEGDEAVMVTRLGTSLRQLSLLLQTWFTMIGLEYVFDDQDRSYLYWFDAETPEKEQAPSA